MIPILIGLLLIGIGVHFYRRNTPPHDAVEVPAVVTDVASKKTSTVGSNRMLHQPTVAYQDPMTGRQVTHTPNSFGTRSYEIGAPVTVFYVAQSQTVMVPLEQPVAQRALPFLGAAIAIAIGVLDIIY